MSFRRWAGIIYAIGIFVMIVRAGEPDSMWWWLGALPFVAWIASPVLGGLWLLRLLTGRAAMAGYFVLLAALAIGGFALQWHTMFIGPSDAQNALILVFVPLYQWFGVIAGLGLCRLFEKVARMFHATDAE